tara:strand:- start:313 stop:1380 length:1068 start_codon:yes stop_codon:yes gene_type:complete
MKTLIIPAAGSSSRFPDMKPKWLLTHPQRELMISRVLTDELVNSYDNIYITILKDHVKKYEADVILEQVFKQRNINNCELVILDHPTLSSPETVYNTIKLKNITQSITIKDSDCLVEFDSNELLNFIVGLDINKTQITNPGNKSYLVKDEYNNIQDIIEKNIVSNYICTGVYSLENVNDFILGYETLKNSELFNESEMYISHIFSYLIQKQIVTVEYIKCTNFIDWGTIADWRNEQEKYKTYVFDIDGVIVKNVGPYGDQNWYNSITPLLENIKIIQHLAEAGNQIIFMTSRDKEGIKLIEQLLEKHNIVYHQIITDCYHSQRVIINDYADTNPYPSCSSISIERNGSLKSFLKY